MRIEHYSLTGTPLGTQRTVTALHFGDETAERKIYIQASLHADELPGALTAYHLRQLLLDLENAGQIKSNIILVPLANPIGLAQSINFTAVARFDLFSGQNFNRLGNLNLFQITLDVLKKNQTTLSSDGNANKKAIRAAMAEALATYSGMSQVENLHLVLLKLACDADVVLDLHCDESAVLHIYTLPELWEVFEPLARCLGSQCQLLAEDSKANPFDEALSTVWAKLGAAYPDANIPLACATTTVELRGRSDIKHEFARQDAQGIVQYLAHQGDIELTEAHKKPLPELLAAPHPLEGKIYVRAPQSGVVVYHVHSGSHVKVGQLVAEVVDPIQGVSVEISSPIDGFVYARNVVQFTQQGDWLVSVSGAVDLGLGASLNN